MEGSMFPCADKDCDMVFPKKAKLDEHRRVAHQLQVTVKHNGDVFMIDRDCERMFRCPIGMGPPMAHKGVQDAGTATVIPCGDEIEVPDVLTKYSLAWNKRCKILICLECHVGVHVSEVWGHGTRAHAPFDYTKDEVKGDLIGYFDLVEGNVFPPDYRADLPCEPVQGLMCYNGYTCKLCNLTWPCKKTIDNHFSMKHAGGKYSSLYGTCLVNAEGFFDLPDLPTEDVRMLHCQRDKCQTLYLHNRTKSFAVLPHVPQFHVGWQPGVLEEQVVEESDPVKRLIEKLELDAVEMTDHGGDTSLEKEQANWIYVTGIHTYIQLMIESGKTVPELVIQVEGINSLEVMVPYIAAWIDKTMKRLHETGQLVKRLCMAETRHFSDPHCPSELEDNKGLMPLQEKASGLKYARILATFMWYLICQAETPLDPDYQLYNVTKASVLRLRDVVAPMRPPLKVPGQSDESDYTRITNNPVGKQVGKVLCSVFQVRTGGWSKQYQTPPMQFLALSTLKADGSYHDSSLLTHLIAAIQYATRLAFAEQYLDTPRGGFDPAADPLQPIKDDDRSLFDFLRKNGPGPFNCIRQLMHLVSTFVLSEALPDTTYWADSALEKLEVENKRVTISGIRNCIHLQQKKADADLAKLLKGCKMPAFDLDLYKEEPHSRKPFTNFLDHLGDEHRKYGHHLLKEWVRRKDVHGLLSDNWKSSMANNTSIYDPALWKRSAMLEWLDAFDRLQERLYFLYHVASGRFVFLMWYHKSRNITGKNKPRLTFLPKRHSMLWFYYLAFLRPTAIFFLKAVNSKDIASQMATKLWVHTRKGPLETSHFTNILKRKFAEGGIAQLGISGWRHVSVAIVDAHIKDHVDVLESGKNAIIDCQRGHNSATANASYGGTGGYDVDRESEKRYKAASKAMHRFWEIDGPVQSGIADPPTDNPIPAGELLELALEKYTGIRQAGTRTPFQADWLTMLFGRNHDMLVVARTGGGKSLGYMLPPLVEHSGITVVVQPLVALVTETLEMLKEKGINHIVFQAGAECVIEKWHRVVVCTTDAAAEEEFYGKLQRHKINQIIIDEAHCYKDDVTYRRYSSGVARLRQLNAPFVFMTATMQIGHEDYLYWLFCITNVKEFTEPTGRPELQFKTVRSSNWEAMIAQVGDIVTHSGLVDCDRNILFIENKKECNNAMDDLKKLYPNLSITKYYSKLEEGEGAANVKLWKTTPKCLMVATSGFGAGINYKHVRNVMIFGLPENDTEINKCFQEAGRAGRDMKAATVWLFETGKPEKGSFAEKIMDERRCIAETFAVPLDGEARDCTAVGCSNMCSHCTAKSASAGHKRKAIEEEELPLPGTQAMYLANVKRACVQANIVDQIALQIVKVRREMAGLCGYCLAKSHDETRHGDNGNKCDKIGCMRCTGGDHQWSTCKAIEMSRVLGKNGSAAYRLCHFCGLGDGHGQDKFHDQRIQGQLKRCDSGLQNVCDQFCWYHFHNERNLLSSLIKILKTSDRVVHMRVADVGHFQQWLGARGWLGCPWANMVTLFIVLRYPDMRKLAQSYVG
ncbi:uncharacterized protein MELLADRAFT_70222 [Melampsora larici-populina 98AG31]|uniref:DNA 3'-5' helicase n=1 Tax=Melampsora larici-populina (strain 98AG31 / pathotype 3-4-7) TaxID=747676 RepID=F4SE37_MELLP|nr:uncharacterized protein MELLADRAFT_70222 [Melampsora larici-populina 98AG31]EGF97090.1 hypothetical protein MELLADRAFT_70222 [Melampsora larici-populina 98AG31]